MTSLEVKTIICFAISVLGIAAFVYFDYLKRKAFPKKFRIIKYFKKKLKKWKSSRL